MNISRYRTLFDLNIRFKKLNQKKIDQNLIGYLLEFDKKPS